MNLTHSTVSSEDGSTTCTFDWTGSVEGQNAVLWTIKFVSADREHVVQLGYKLVDDEFSAQFAFDFSAGRQQNFTEAVKRSNSHLEATFPYDLLSNLGPGYSHSATLTVDGQDMNTMSIDYAPRSGQGGTVAN